MQRHTHPFVHYSLPDFLPPSALQKLARVYQHLQFLEKESDLFHFFQTNELAQEPSLGFFRKELSKQFEKLAPLKETWYSIFASYYFKGNHLLCHDDVVEDRRFAFSFYIEDFGSGELVLYNRTADAAAKKIKVCKNLLVIFQVSNISYHEVALAKQDGRKAVTGWLNQKGWGATRAPKATLPYQPNFPLPNMIAFSFPQDISDEDEYIFPGIDYQFNVKSMHLTGPFFERRAWRLELEQQVVMKLKGYSLLSADFFQFSRGDYLLLNDPVNSIQGDILDVFILSLPKGPLDANFITVVGEDGSVEGHVPYADQTMFIVHRKQKKYYIDLVQKEVRLAHLIYRRESPKQKKPQSKTSIAVEPHKAKKTKQKAAKASSKKAVQGKQKKDAVGEGRKRKTIKRDMKRRVAKGRG